MRYILYTEDEGGNFISYRGRTDAETTTIYQNAISTRRLSYTDGFADTSSGSRYVNIVPAYICLLEAIDGYDFVSNRHRIGSEIVEEPKNIEMKAEKDVEEISEIKVQSHVDPKKKPTTVK